MKHFSRMRSRVARTQRGFSIIELVVASAVGLFVLGATFVAYQNSSYTSRAAQAQSQMAEDAALALGQMRHFIAQAGYSAPITGAVDGGFNLQWNQRAVFGCDHGFGNLNATVDTQTCVTTGPAPDAIGVAFQADAANSLLNAANVPLDCLGNPTLGVGTPVTYYVSYNRFYVANRQLMCRGYDTSPAQPLLDNVEDMVITYGVSATGNGNVSYYTNAASITNWANVVSVRVCIVLRSNQPVMQEPMPYWGCNPFGAAITPGSTDLFLYRAYTMTVGLRNRMGVEI